VRFEYSYGKSRLLKHIANKEWLSLAIILVLFVTNNQTGKCTYKVTFWRIRVTTFAVEKQ